MLGSGSSFERLPDEVKIQILSYLCRVDLGEIAVVSQLWNTLAADQSLWRKVKLLPSMTDEDLFKIIDKHPYITDFSYNYAGVMEGGLNRLLVQCGPTLTHLHLNSCFEVSPHLVELIVTFCTSLLYLDLSSNLAVDDVTMCQLTGCSALTQLRICNSDSVTDSGLEMLLQHRSLELLDASYLLNVRGKTIDNLIASSANCLHTLLLDGGNLSDADVSKLSNLPNLQLLDIQYCDELTDTGLASLSHLPRLTTLKLGRCFNVTSKCVEGLVTSVSLISTLILTDCSEVDDGGLVSVGAHLPLLRHLELSQSYGHGVTDVGMSAVLLGCTRLDTLLLRGLKGVRYFPALIPVLRSSCLRMLHLGGCRNVPKPLLERVAAFSTELSVFGHYAQKILPNKFIKECME